MDKTKFLKKFTEYFGEKTDDIAQISKVTFNGEELLEFLNFCNVEPNKMYYLAKIKAIHQPTAYRLVIAPTPASAYDKTVDYISKVSMGKCSVEIVPVIV